jgi:hypothetical protein
VYVSSAFGFSKLCDNTIGIVSSCLELLKSSIIAVRSLALYVAQSAQIQANLDYFSSLVKLLLLCR